MSCADAAARLPAGPRSAGMRPGRVKRRKTKRERDSAKFVPPLPVWGCRCAGRPLRSPVSAPKPVVITQNRLSQHLGMFNREVKSIDIERLLSPSDLPAAPSPATDPSLQCLPEGQPRTEHGSGEPWPNVPPLGPGLERGAAGLPWREIACKLRVLLGRTLAFPGRDLVGERRQTILAVLQRPTAEPCASRHPDLVRGAAPATANVFGSAWSPGTFELAEHQLPPAPGWPHSARRHGSCSRWPRRALEGLVPCRETWELGRSNLPASSQHGVCWWEHQGSPESYQPWDHKAWELPETGPGRSLLGPEDAERLRALRRLPMSFFPPSEALERGGSPPFLAHGCLPVYSSPEAWVFPRMKLY
uniref:Uncharacterized protein n=1 Tax=Apteryx owenii TaxID=8824 RepID=A0A8B9P9U4_APTOW